MLDSESMPAVAIVLKLELESSQMSYADVAIGPLPLPWHVCMMTEDMCHIPNSMMDVAVMKDSKRQVGNGGSA